MTFPGDPTNKKYAYTKASQFFLFSNFFFFFNHSLSPFFWQTVYKDSTKHMPSPSQNVGLFNFL